MTTSLDLFRLPEIDHKENWVKDIAKILWVIEIVSGVVALVSFKWQVFLIAMFVFVVVEIIYQSIRLLPIGTIKRRNNEIN